MLDVQVSTTTHRENAAAVQVQAAWQGTALHFQPQAEKSSCSGPGSMEGQAGPCGCAEAATSCPPDANTVEGKGSSSSGCKAA